MADEKYDILKRYFGYDTFREGQEQVIDELISGRDVLGVMPTGAGKSLCYQIPGTDLSGDNTGYFTTDIPHEGSGEGTE